MLETQQQDGAGRGGGDKNEKSEENFGMESHGNGIQRKPQKTQ